MYQERSGVYCIQNITGSIETKKFPLLPSGKYRVVFQHKHVGCYETIEEARQVYTDCIVKLYEGGY